MVILIAVSGGVDSMYLAWRRKELFPGADFAVAHCNFSLRGEESDGDEAFVRDWCRENGVPIFVKRFDTTSYAAANGISIEMAARDLRYAWFAELCAGTASELVGSGFSDFDALAVAHNANDNAETLLLNLLRGTGTKGLRGMSGGPDSCGYDPLKTSASLHPGSDAAAYAATPPIHKAMGGHGFQGVISTTAMCGIQLFRPLLNTERRQIEAWMISEGHAWREDRTNAENDAKRNRIRNQVFPLLAGMNPSFVRTFGRDMRHIAQVDDIAEDYYLDAADAVVRDGAINLRELLKLKHWEYVLWRLVEQYNLSEETFEKLTELLESGRTISGKTFESPTHVLSIRKKTLTAAPRAKE